MAKTPTSPPVSTEPSPQSRFLSLIKGDILKLDVAELDFGIYRILNYRRAQVLAYLDDTLPGRITAWTDALTQSDGRELARTEAENCYYHLHTFFARYWDDGDFIPRARRGGTAAYAVPYHGQDTHFHWATKGSHYVKSGELFARYAYKDGAHDVRFTLERAEVEKDNAKGSAKHFFPARVQAVDGGFELLWQWRAATEAENKRYKNKSALRSKDVHEEDISLETDAETPTTEGASLQARVLNAWAAGDDFADAKRPHALNPELLASTARRFVRKNTSDFFVHPQLGDFLRGELDVYLKHEFVQVWDAADAELPRIRAKFNLVRHIALDLITFLDQIERFQATLFEKRKFVLQADYLVQCSWLLREGGAEGKKLVTEATSSTAQAEEWASWVGLAPSPSGRGSGVRASRDGKKLLTAYPHLPLHTRHFSADFKASVLACFDDIEAALGGELLHGDNYAALRTLEPAYRERVKCIYIDPPYNTGGDGFMYKDEFLKHSSWIAFMESRLLAARSLMSDASVQFTSIDENEHTNLLHVSNSVFGAENFVTNVIWQKNFSPKNTAQHFSEDHDYVTVHAKNKALWRPTALERTEEQDAAFSNPDDDHRGVWTSGDLSARNYYSEGIYSMTSPSGRVIPGPPPGTFWRVSRTKFDELQDDKRIWWGADGGNVPRLKRFLTEVKQGRVPQTLWTHKDVGHTQEGKQALLSMMALSSGDDVFNTLKPPRLIERCIRIGDGTLTLDFFAGSGTTGHAVINLNREDGGARKFLLVEQGEYFDSVTLPRIAKVMTAPEWKDGAPKDTVNHDASDDAAHWSRRTLPLVRVLRLERYEDSLNALDFESNQALAHEKPAQAAIDLVASNSQAHLLRYWLMDDSAASPVRLSTQRLTAPFAYQLTLHEPAGDKLAPVDLLETARLLLGLVPRRQRELSDPQGQRHQLMEAVLASDFARETPHPKTVLLWLRTVDDERSEAAAQAEHDWLSGAVRAAFSRPLTDYASIFHNRAAFWPAGAHGQSIDSLLAERMMERAR